MIDGSIQKKSKLSSDGENYGEKSGQLADMAFGRAHFLCKSWTGLLATFSKTINCYNISE